MVTPRKPEEDKLEAGRKSLYKEEYCDIVKELLMDGYSLAAVSVELNVCRATINNWMENFPEFLEAVGVAKAHASMWWQERARTLATDGIGNAGIVQFSLKNLDDDFTDKSKIDHTSQGEKINPVQVDFVGGSDSK